jgi:endonuclease/exonuclease/phosphatase (EEP) superfamily protein YafD
VTVVVAALLAAIAFPLLGARAIGGQPPHPLPKLAALAPVATVPAVASVAIAASTTWWLALLLAFPAATLAAWQVPALRQIRHVQAAVPSPPSHEGSRARSMRILTLNVQHGSADPAALVRHLDVHQVDVLAVQELTPDMVRRLVDVGVGDRLRFCHLNPRPGAAGTGLWARWPMTILPAVPGLAAAAPRACIDLGERRRVVLTAVHVIAPLNGEAQRWQRELARIRAALMDVSAPQVAAGDFNASRDHRPFRDLLAAGFVDCADVARKRPWLGFTWPVRRAIPPVIRLDHVLVSDAGFTVIQSRTIHVNGTDHRGVLAVLEVQAERLA